MKNIYTPILIVLQIEAAEGRTAESQQLDAYKALLDGLNGWLRNQQKIKPGQSENLRFGGTSLTFGTAQIMGSLFDQTKKNGNGEPTSDASDSLG